MKIYSKYDLPVDKGIKCETESLTQPQFEKDCDINCIMKQYEKTGVLPSGERKPVFDDVSQVSSLTYQEAINLVDDVDSKFDELPASTRERFKNDPVELLSFLNDISNEAEAVKLGLISGSSEPVSDTSVKVSDDKAQLPT